MTPEEYHRLEEQLVRDIATDLVLSDDFQLDDWDHVHAHITAVWDDIFAGVPESDLTRCARPQNFRPRDWTDLNNTVAESAIENIAFGAVVESVYGALTEFEDAIETAALLHEAFDSLCLHGDVAPYTTSDGWPNPSLLVTAFFTWLGEQDAAGSDWAHEVNASMSFEDFNEAHVRGLTAIDPIGDYTPDAGESLSDATSPTVDAIWDWVAEKHPDYLP